MKLTRSLKLLVVSVAALAFAVGCSCGEKEKPPAKAPAAMPQATTAPAAPRPAPKPGPTYKSVHEQLQESVDLPAFYPKDAPVYPKSRISEAGRTGARISSIQSTEDSADQVMTFVKNDLTSQGWQDIADAEMPGGSMVQAHKPGRKISVLVSRLDAENRTLIMVSVDP